MRFLMLGQSRVYQTMGEKMAFQYRQMALLIRSGMTPLNAMDALIESCRQQTIRKNLILLKETILKTDVLMDRGKKAQKFYNDVVIFLLKKEEDPELVASFLEDFARLLENMEKQKKRFLSSLVYPGTALTIAFFILAVVLIFVIPVFQEMFESFGGMLPAPTRFVIQVSEFVSAHMVWIMLCFVVLYYIVKQFKHQILVAISWLPMIGTLIKGTAVLQFSRYLGVLIKLDVNLQEAVSYSALGVTNTVYSNRLKQMALSATESSMLIRAMEQTSLFDDVIMQAAMTGQKTEKLGIVFEQIAAFCDEHLEFSFVRLNTLLDAVMILFVGAVIGGMVIAMYLPIFSMAGAI